MPGTSLRQRNLQPEVMDQPDLDAGEHHHALEALARINRISFSPRILWRPIRRLCELRKKSGDSRPVRVLDVATGGGDVPVRIWQMALAAAFPGRGRRLRFQPGRDRTRPIAGGTEQRGCDVLPARRARGPIVGRV